MKRKRKEKMERGNENKTRKAGLRRNSNLFLIFILLTILLITVQTGTATTQEAYITVDFDISEKGQNPQTSQEISPQIVSIRIKTRNAYYALFEQEPDDPYYGTEAENIVQLLDATGQVIYQDIFTFEWLAPYYEETAKLIALSASGDVILETPLSFCNENGRCEPCTETGCVSTENSLVCQDCQTGTQDNFCDLKRDGRCDPDCFGVDGDCEFCDTRCYYEEMQNFSCAALGGEICGMREECTGGYMTYSEDSHNSCCMEGKCRNLGEYVETMSEMQNQPISTITPEGKTAAEIYAYGTKEKYCTKTLGGRICSSEEECNGEEIEYYYGAYCCKGGCERKETRSVWARVMSNGETVTLSEEEEENLRAIEYGGEQQQNVMGENTYFASDILKAIQDRDNLRYDAEREELKEVRKEKIKNAISKVTGYTPKTTAGIIIYAAGAAVIAVLFVIFAVRLFRRRAVKETDEQKIYDSEKKVIKEREIKERDLQPVINSIISKGFTYEQAKKYLLEKGYDQQRINEEIVKNYNARRNNPNK